MSSRSFSTLTPFCLAIVDDDCGKLAEEYGLERIVKIFLFINLEKKETRLTTV